MHEINQRARCSVWWSEGQSPQLVEPLGGGERDQTGAEAAVHLHAQPAVAAHAVTELTEGTAQQPPGTARLQVSCSINNTV